MVEFDFLDMMEEGDKAPNEYRPEEEVTRDLELVEDE